MKSPKPAHSPILAEFGSRLRARRAASRHTQEGLANDAGLHPSYISQVERGQRNISLHNIVRIAKALKIDPAELIVGLEWPDDETEFRSPDPDRWL